LVKVQLMTVRRPSQFSTLMAAPLSSGRLSPAWDPTRPLTKARFWTVRSVFHAFWRMRTAFCPSRVTFPLPSMTMGRGAVS
jgi:hypothetical protein